MDLIFPIPWAESGEREVVPQSAPANGSVSFELGFGGDYEKDLLKDPDAKNIERKKLNYILNQLCEAVNTLSKKDGLPVGMPIPWPSLAMPPEGNFIAYDGRKFDTAANPKLAALFPNGYLLDLRGVVIRGFDGRSAAEGCLDIPGRALLSYQEDTIQNITGQFPMDSNVYNNGFAGPFYRGGGAGNQGNTGRGSAIYCGFNLARAARTSTETRMKNITLNYITKAG